MARVTGVGGVFLRSADPARLAQWYADRLGLAVGAGHMAMVGGSDAGEGANGSEPTIWSVFPQQTEYFGAGNQAVMINYRVDDLPALLEQLAAAGVWVDPHRENSEFGQFAWVKDCDGNRVELWQAAAEADGEVK